MLVQHPLSSLPVLPFLLSQKMSLSAPLYAPPRVRPPHFLDTDHRLRCLTQLRSKPDGIEKYIYMSSLKERDPNLFYEVLLANMLEIIPVLYTPTVRPPPTTAT